MYRTSRSFFVLIPALLAGCAAEPVDHVGQDTRDTSGRLVAGFSSYVDGMLQQQSEGICMKLGFAASTFSSLRSKGVGISEAKAEVRQTSAIFATTDEIYLADTVMNKLATHPELRGPDAVYYAQEGCALTKR